MMRLSSSILTIFVFILPFVYFSNIFNPYETPKFLFYVIGIEFLVIYFIFRFLFTSEESLRLRSGPPSEVLLWIFISGFVIINLVSNLFGLDPKVSFLGSNIRHQGFVTLISSVLLFFFSRFSSDKTIIFKKTALICAFLISLVAIFQAVQLNIFNSSIWTYNGRIVGTFGNPNFWAGYLVMLLPLVLFLDSTRSDLVRLSRFNLDRIRTPLSLLMLVVIYFTNSFSGFLA